MVDLHAHVVDRSLRAAPAKPVVIVAKQVVLRIRQIELILQRILCDRAERSRWNDVAGERIANPGAIAQLPRCPRIVNLPKDHITAKSVLPNHRSGTIIQREAGIEQIAAMTRVVSECAPAEVPFGVDFLWDPRAATARNGRSDSYLAFSSRNRTSIAL